MLHRTAYFASPRVALRVSFSTTANRQVDLSNLYSKLTGWRRKTPKSEVVDPTEARDSHRADNSMPEVSKPRKLEVIGKPKTLEEDWPEVKQYAEFIPWPTNHHNKNLTRDQISTVMQDVQNVDFSNIEARFNAVKSISTTLGLAIPDAVFTNLNSAAELEKHLQSSAVKFDEKQPDAVYLDPSEFVGTNVIISDPLQERRDRKKRMHDLVNEAKEAQRKNADEIMRAQN